MNLPRSSLLFLRRVVVSCFFIRWFFSSDVSPAATFFFYFSFMLFSRMMVMISLRTACNRWVFHLDRFHWNTLSTWIANPSLNCEVLKWWKKLWEDNKLRILKSSREQIRKLAIKYTCTRSSSKDIFTILNKFALVHPSWPNYGKRRKTNYSRMHEVHCLWDWKLI